MLIDVAVVAISLLLGWAALWPGRRQLGTLAYHVLAYPIGVLAWGLISALTTATGMDFGAVAVAVGVALFLGLIWGTQRGISSGEGPPPSSRSFLASGLVIVGSAVVVVLMGTTISGWDSIIHYEIPGLNLLEGGSYSRDMMGEWAPLLPSLHAANRLFGSDWTYVPYPLFAGHALVLFGYAMHRFALSSLGPRPRLVLSITATLSLAVLPAFVLHSLNVHSQMVSALYLLLALVALRASCQDSSARGVWALIAGLGASGLALSRPDGLAYVFVPGLVAAALIVSERWSRTEVARFVAGHLVLLGASYLTAFSQLGLWESRKLTGEQAALMLGASVVLALALFVLPRVRPLMSLPSRRRVIVGLLSAGAALVVAAVVVLEPAGCRKAGTNMVTNLFVTGGYGHLWWGVAAGSLVTLFFPRILRSADFSDLLILALIQFFAIAFTVHSLAFPGRLHPADSFNRVAFHSLPLFAWYLTAFAGTAVAAVLRAREPGPQHADL